MTTASGTALLDRLERAGHVRRAPRTDDRRRIDIVVTASAKELGWSFFGPLIDATVAVLGARTPEQRAVIDSFLDDMVAALTELGRPRNGNGPTPIGPLGSRGVNERASAPRSTARPGTRPTSAGEEES
jgi:hypothetical protein